MASHSVHIAVKAILSTGIASERWISQLSIGAFWRSARVENLRRFAPASSSLLYRPTSDPNPHFTQWLFSYVYVFATRQTHATLLDCCNGGQTADRQVLCGSSSWI